MGTIFEARIELTAAARLPAERFVALARGLVAEGILALPGAVIADAAPGFDPFCFDSAGLEEGRAAYEGEDLEALLAAIAAVYDETDVAVYFAGCGSWRTEAALHALREPATISTVGVPDGDPEDEEGGEYIEPPPTEIVGVFHAISMVGKGAPILEEEIEDSPLGRFLAAHGVPVGTVAVGAC